MAVSLGLHWAKFEFWAIMSYSVAYLFVVCLFILVSQMEKSGHLRCCDMPIMPALRRQGGVRTRKSRLP